MFFCNKKKYLVLPAFLLLLLVVGCGNSKTASSTNVKTPIPMATAANGTVNATVTLTHEPVGTANLIWNHTSHDLTVQISLTGLAPNSVHPAHIHEGSCANQGKVLYPLTDVTADTYGVANVTTTVNVPGGIPTSGWSVNVHNGPGLTDPNEFLPIACADIANHDTSLRSSQSVQVPFATAPASSAGQSVIGIARLTLVGHTLTLQMELTGLLSSSEQMAHIHSGSCASQGPVVYALPIIMADGSGKAITTAQFTNVSAIPQTGWYINVHRSTALSTQTGFDPVACGNVVLK
jgi:hypothetical protein